MVEKLSITIGLEGGKEVERQLKGIGEAGQKAFLDIAKAAEAAGGFKNLKPEEVTAKLKEMGIVGEEAFRKIMEAVQTATEFEKVIEQTKKTEARMEALATAVKSVGAAALAAGAALVKAFLSGADAINKIDSAAIKAGMSIEKFDQLQKVLTSAGISAGAVAEGIGKIGGAIEQAKLGRVAAALKEIQERPGTGQGSGAFQLLTEMVQGVGPAADAARAALEKIGAVNIPEGPVQKIRDMITSTTDAAQAARLFIGALEKMPDGANRSAAAIALLGQTFGTEVIQTLRTGNLTVAQFDQVVSTLSQTTANSANSMQQSFNRVNSSYESLKTTIFAQVGDAGLTRVLDGINKMLQDTTTWEQWKEAGKQAFITVFAPLGELQVKFAQFVATLGGDIWGAFASAGTAAINAVMGALDRLWEKLKSIGGAIAGAFSGGGGGGPAAGSVPGNATGGLIGGRGSGTSDSNLAWVSRGEHIMPARAVAQPGVLALLEALRRTGGNLRGVMDGMGRFALGGVVPQLPRFAEGGLVGGMQHLGTVDLRTDHGTARLMASSSAVEQLTRLAVTKRMTSTGKKPGFIG